jgi:hypothetical protein
MLVISIKNTAAIIEKTVKSSLPSPAHRAFDKSNLMLK